MQCPMIVFSSGEQRPACCATCSIFCEPDTGPGPANVLFTSRFDSNAVLRYRMGWLTYMADG
jgi:hypothetical protein